jgi:hypothetical protein
MKWKNDFKVMPVLSYTYVIIKMNEEKKWFQSYADVIIV